MDRTDIEGHDDMPAATTATTAMLNDPTDPATTQLHRRHANGLSLHEALDHVTRGEHLPALGLRWPAATAQDGDALNSMRGVCTRLVDQWHGVAAATDVVALQLVRQSRWSARWQQHLLRTSQQMQSAAEQTATQAEQLRQLLGLPPLLLNRKGRVALAVLARSLPQTRGHDWRFMLRPDSARICSELRQAAGQLSELRLLQGQLTAPWSDETLQHARTCADLLSRLRTGLDELPQAWPADVYSALVHGVGLLSTHLETSQQLTASYTPDVSQLDVNTLLHSWEHANSQVWPASWMGRRKVLGLLGSTIQGPLPGQRTDVGGDLRRLVRLRQLAAELAALQPMASHVELPWPDLQTPLDEARAALTVQTALRHAHAGTAWSVQELQAVVQQRGGSPMADTAQRLCELHALDEELAAQSAGLAAATDGQWTGRKTDPDRLQGAIAYQLALRAQLGGTDWQADDELERVRRGDCGATLADDLQRLERMQSLQARLAASDAALRDETCGLWQGLATRADEVELALKSHGSVSAAISTLATSPAVDTAIRNALSQLLVPGTLLLSPSGALISAGRGYLNMLAGLQTAIDAWATQLHADATLRAVLNDADLNQLMTHAHELRQAREQLRSWCGWYQARSDARAAGLTLLVRALEKGLLNPDQLMLVFEADYCRWWLQQLAEQPASELLDNVFASTQYEAREFAEGSPLGAIRQRRRAMLQRRERALQSGSGNPGGTTHLS